MLGSLYSFKVGKVADTDLLRKKIIDMPYTEWNNMVFSKGTLHYMKQNAMSDKPFSPNAHVRKKVEHWGKMLKELKVNLSLVNLPIVNLSINKRVIIVNRYVAKV